MNCLVTAGPTAEPLDQVRRLTNRSTGRLGTELANHLVAAGHRVTLLLGELATWTGERRAHRVERFATVTDLQRCLQTLAEPSVDALFHAAAVSDFGFGRVYERLDAGGLREIRAGKLPTRTGPLLAELLPTPKLIAGLRLLFPNAFLVGWKYEVDGTTADALARAREQLAACHTNACVANGPAYGLGFGLVDSSGALRHLPDATALYTALDRAVRLAVHAAAE